MATLKALINATLIHATLIFETLIFANFLQIRKNILKIRDSQKLVSQKLMKIKNFRKS